MTGWMEVGAAVLRTDESNIHVIESSKCLLVHC